MPNDKDKRSTDKENEEIDKKVEAEGLGKVGEEKDLKPTPQPDTPITDEMRAAGEEAKTKVKK